MLAPSPQPLTKLIISDYRDIMTRVDPEDWEGHKRRVDTARRLARRAFDEKDRAAWEVVQVIEWRLQRRNGLRPTEPGDVHVLDAIYRIEEAASPLIECPEGLSAKQFTERLSADCYALNALDTPFLKMLGAGKLSAEDWKYFAYQLLAPAGDFTRMLAIASVRFPFELSLSVCENLYEEAGEGVSERAHVNLLYRFARHFGVDTGEEALLDWTCPEILANTNAQNRMLWHYEMGWSLGSNFLMERLLPPEFGRVRDALVAAGLTDEVLEWFTVHLVADEEHAADWLRIIEEHFSAPEDRRIAYRAAIERGRWNRLGWESLYPAWEQWKATGNPPRVPARELREATGL
jgi:pyrroloquinoline quinone (PQQ) biosynthesis protein C